MTLPEQFVKERVIFKNVSKTTVSWYQQSFKAFHGALDSKAAVGQRIQEMRDRGVQPISINSYLRCLRAYFTWGFTEGHLPAHIKLSYIKAEQKVIETLTPQQTQLLLSYKPRCLWDRRIHILCVTVLDTGLRISEVLALRESSLDIENMVIKVLGKGGKHRLVPISLEMRKLLYRHVMKPHPRDYQGKDRLLFGTGTGTKLRARNANRDMTKIGKALGITGVRFSPHTLRHTFAVTYLRAGGNLFYLSKIMGHRDIKTTQIYLQSLGITDYVEVHSNLTALSAKR